LEGKVEFGEKLRVVTLSENNFEVKEIINKIFKEIPEFRVKNKIPVNFHNHFMIDKLRNNKNIIERNFPDWHISSFNFSDKVFYKRIWDRETVRARGLFVNTNTYEIVARSYEKFFNINEREDTELNFIKNKFNYPVSVYVKENGYLGILGYDSENDKLIFSSKASLDNDFAKWFTEIFLEKHESKRIEIKKYLKENNVSFVFEVVLKDKDPHIIEYSEDRLILLDIVKRDFDFSKYKYDKLLEVANNFGIEAKKLFKVLENENQFLDFYKIETERNINEEYLEGFVLEDSANFMIKVKLAYYGFWKGVRNYLEDFKIKSSPNPFFIKKGSTAVKPRKDIANEKLFLDFEKWRQENFKNEEWKNKNIIELRNEFLKNKI
jgi:tRNA splicing ligase